MDSLTRSEIVERIDKLDASSISQYNARYYAVDYRTTYTGKPVETRGLLIIPEEVDSLPLVC